MSTITRSTKTATALPYPQTTLDPRSNRPPSPRLPNKKPTPSPLATKHFYYSPLRREPSPTTILTRIRCTLPGTTTTPPTPILNQNTYSFPSLFTHMEHSSTLSLDRTCLYPTPADILLALDPRGAECVGNACFTSTICEDTECQHPWEEWEKSSTQWEEWFELRETVCKGIGVFCTRDGLGRGCVIGWYAGVLGCACRGGDYVVEMCVGHLCTVFLPSSACLHDGVDQVAGGVITIDARERGNWTRFINHSCAPHARFHIMRQGRTVIVAVVLHKDIRAGEELTVGYGEGYWRGRQCLCGSKVCVSLSGVNNEG